MKVLFVLLLAIVVFGAGGYYTYKLFVKPRQELQEDRALGPPPALPDPTLPEYDRCVELQQSARLVEARAAFTDFVEHNPESSKLEDAKERLGVINSYIFLSNYPAPEKETYRVEKGDVITKVAAKLHATPELIMKANDLHGIILRIGQHITVAPSDFALEIKRGEGKVVLLNYGKFFKQYQIVSAPNRGSKPAATPASGARKPGPTPRPPKIVGKVTEKLAWFNGQRVTPFDKDKGQAYAEADHWIEISPSGHSLYTDHSDEAGKQPNKPPGGGYGLASDAMQELAAMLNKNTPVTIE